MPTSRIRQLLLAAAFIAFGDAALAEPGFDRSGWLSDLAVLRDTMSAGYANLEWAATERGLDLATVYADAKGHIESASDENAARSALENFLAAFADGHLEVTWPGAPQADAEPASLCARLGFLDAGDKSLATHLPGFRPLGETGHFPAGLVDVGARRIGVLRLASFEPQGFPDLCPAALTAGGLNAGSVCDAACEERVTRLADGLLLAEFEARVRELSAAHPAALLIDLVRNGGGDDIALPMAQMLTGKALHAPRMSFVRGPRWRAEITERQKTIRAALVEASAEDRALLRQLDASLTIAGRLAAKPCDRAPLWSGKAISCSQLVPAPFFASGLVDTIEAGRFAGRPWGEAVSATAGLAFTPGLWSGRLLVLTDRGTASASELFAAMLQDAHAATVIGLPTLGAGCGHALVRRDLTLPHSHAQVSMPDCARLRADGRNEIGGIEPDRLIGWRGTDTPHQRIERLRALLPALLDAPGEG